jgi:hypothetical protein
MSIFRAYFFDLDTRQELTDHPLNGKQWLGTDANVKDANGKYVDGTTTAVEIARHASLRSVKDIRRVTAAVELLIAHLARKLDSMIKQRGEVASEQGAQPVIHFYKVRNNQTRKSEARYVYLTRETFDAAKAEDKARRPIDRCLDGFYGEAATFDGFKARDLAKRDREIERVKADIVELTARFNSWTQTHRWNRTSKTWEVL